MSSNCRTISQSWLHLFTLWSLSFLSLQISMLHDLFRLHVCCAIGAAELAGERATWKWFDLLVNFTEVVISVLWFDGTGSEVTREIWEMRLLTLWPRLQLVGGVICCETVLQSLFSTLLQLGCAIPEPLWSMVCECLHFSQRLCVGESSECCVLRFVGHRDKVPVCVS